MFENPRRGRQARNFTTNVPKILDLKSSLEQIFFRKLSLGAPEVYIQTYLLRCNDRQQKFTTTRGKKNAHEEYLSSGLRTADQPFDHN